MHAVIFRATIAVLDEEYRKKVALMRDLAFNKYGCLDFVAISEGSQEIAISYWKDEKSIKQWKNDPEHLIVQELGRSKWYESYSVEVVEVKRQYSHKS